MQQKIQKRFFVSEIIASELVSLNCNYKEQNTFHRQPICWQAVSGFCMPIRETFSNSISLPVIDELDKGAVMQISIVFEPVHHIACRSIL